MRFMVLAARRRSPGAGRRRRRRGGLASMKRALVDARARGGRGRLRRRLRRFLGARGRSRPDLRRLRLRGEAAFRGRRRRRPRSIQRRSDGVRPHLDRSRRARRDRRTYARRPRHLARDRTGRSSEHHRDVESDVTAATRPLGWTPRGGARGRLRVASVGLRRALQTSSDDARAEQWIKRDAQKRASKSTFARASARPDATARRPRRPITMGMFGSSKKKKILAAARLQMIADQAAREREEEEARRNNDAASARSEETPREEVNSKLFVAPKVRAPPARLIPLPRVDASVARRSRARSSREEPAARWTAVAPSIVLRIGKRAGRARAIENSNSSPLRPRTLRRRPSVP